MSCLEALLEDVEATTHHQYQQALGIHFDETDAAKCATIDSENRGGQQQKELTALIPTVGDDRQLKTTRQEQSNVD